MERKTGKKILNILIRILPFLIIGTLIFLFWEDLQNITFEQIVNYTPKNLFLAAIVIIGIYGIKSLTVVFPLIVLYLASGVLFSFWPAMLVNMLGLLLCISIPYVIGRFSGTHLIDFLIKKFKKVQKINDLQSANTLFTSYLLRVVSILPGDIVSLYFGASKAKFFPYCVGSLLGLSPIMIIQTLMGENLDDLFSLKFFLLFLLMIVISFASSRIFNQKIKESEKK